MATTRKPAPACDICGQPCPRANMKRCSPECRREWRRRDDAGRLAYFRARYAANPKSDTARTRAYYAAHRADLLRKKRRRYERQHAARMIRCHCGRRFTPQRDAAGRPKRFFCAPACRWRQQRLACARLIAAYYAAFRSRRCSLSCYRSLPLIETATTD